MQIFLSVCLSASLIYQTTASLIFGEGRFVCLVCPHPLYTRSSLIYQTTASLVFGEGRFVCLVCPHPLYTRSPHPSYTRPYRTIQKIPYHIPENTVPHTRKYRTTYQMTTIRKIPYHIPDEDHTKIPYHIPDDTGTLPYKTVPKIPYHIPDEHHTKNTVPHTRRVPYKQYRTTYQKNTVQHTRRYRNPAIQYRTYNTVPHTRPYHTIPTPCLTIPYPYPAIPHRTLPVCAPTHNSAQSTGHSTQVRSSTSLLLVRKREASAVEPVASVSDVGRRVRPRWTLFL